MYNVFVQTRYVCGMVWWMNGYECTQTYIYVNMAQAEIRKNQGTELMVGCWLAEPR